MKTNLLVRVAFVMSAEISFLCGACDQSPVEEPLNGVFYVSTTGDDANPGTQERPWRTVQKAADSLAPGETVRIQEGTYSERIQPLKSGTADAYIMYTAQPGKTVTIDGSNVVVPEWGGLFEINGRAYIRVSGLRMVNAGPNPHSAGILVEASNHISIESNDVRNTNDAGIAVWDSHHVTITGNEVEAACQSGFNEGISVAGSDQFEVSYNHVHDTAIDKEGIAAKDGSANGSIFGNNVHDVDSTGIYVDAWDKYTHDIEVFGNVVYDVDGNGITLASEQGGLLENVSIDNNIAYGNQWAGIDVSECCTDKHPIRGIRIVNNTLYDNGRDPWGGGVLVENPQAEGVVIRNNICSRNLTFQIDIATSVPTANVTVDHNLIDGYRGDEGEVYGEASVTGDPMFLDAHAGDFRLGVGSAALDLGSDEDAPTVDINGAPRPQGIGVDIGAYERLSAMQDAK